MTEQTYAWDAIATLTGSELKKAVFGIMKDASMLINSLEVDDPRVLEIVPRLASLITLRDELNSFREPFSALARSVGLWNYIDKEHSDFSDNLLAEAVTAPELGGITFHREQIAALSDVLAGRNLILSAPTSFGKSLLIDAVLASGKYSRVSIIVPTIALLDETRRRLNKRFGTRFQIVMHANEVAAGQEVIFLGTQERILSRNDLGALDLTVVDEFYKLDPARKDDRNIALNAVVYKLLKISKQFFFLGPNINSVKVAEEGRWKFNFFRTNFSTVAVDIYDLQAVKDKENRLYDEMVEDKNWPALVFVSSPDRANRFAAEASKRMAVSDESADFAVWLSENYGAKWFLPEVVANGLGVHHGRIPRSVASQMIRMFNEGAVPVLLCTSTLIEGVNTAAKTVMIYDKKISRDTYDFFTFSNIKGRAGRLGQHQVGKVYLFNAPPHEQSTQVAPTVFAHDDDAPLDYIVHLDPSDMSRATSNRIVEARGDLQLDVTDLKLASSIGLENAMKIKERVDLGVRQGEHLLWHGRPSYEQIQALTKVLCDVYEARFFGAKSSDQLSFYINDLRKPRRMKDFFKGYNSNFRGSSTEYDNIFKFLRSCEYGLPQNISIVELFARRYELSVDYSLLLGGMPRWFRPEDLKNLEEEGLPIQITERFYREGDSREQLIERIKLAASSASPKFPNLSEFERRWIASLFN